MAPGAAGCTYCARKSACVWSVGSPCRQGVVFQRVSCLPVSVADASVSSHHDTRWVKRIVGLSLAFVVPFGEGVLCAVMLFD